VNTPAATITTVLTPDPTSTTGTDPTAEADGGADDDREDHTPAVLQGAFQLLALTGPGSGRAQARHPLHTVAQHRLPSPEWGWRCRVCKGQRTLIATAYCVDPKCSVKGEWPRTQESVTANAEADAPVHQDGEEHSADP
jgi:hypothetical protein